jgi:hypothetical protein
MLPLPGGGTQVDVFQAVWLVEPGILRMAPMLYVPALTGEPRCAHYPTKLPHSCPILDRTRDDGLATSSDRYLLIKVFGLVSWMV